MGADDRCAGGRAECLPSTDGMNEIID